MVDLQSPFTGGSVKEVSTTEEMEFRGEIYPDIPVKYYVCVDTGEKFTDGNQDEAWTKTLYSAYRKRHGIPEPEQIKAIREHYGLNVAQMTRVLGFGKNQLAWYEDGQVPSLTNGRLLSLIQDPTIMRKCVELAALDETEKRAILRRIR